MVSRPCTSRTTWFTGSGDDNRRQIQQRATKLTESPTRAQLADLYTGGASVEQKQKGEEICEGELCIY